MKIAITSQGEELNSAVDERLGRTKGFMIYDYESKEYNYLPNTQDSSAAQGAGIQAARTLIGKGIGVLITGNVGPKAFSALKQAGIEIYICSSGSISEAISSFRDNKLKKATGANVKGHW